MGSNGLFKNIFLGTEDGEGGAACLRMKQRSLKVIWDSQTGILGRGRRQRATLYIPKTATWTQLGPRCFYNTLRRHPLSLPASARPVPLPVAVHCSGTAVAYAMVRETERKEAIALRNAPSTRRLARVMTQRGNLQPTSLLDTR